MGESLYEHVAAPVSQGGLNRPCRIYAPVGTHETLLAYLVRRLLENGANTSFVNQIGDADIAIDALIADPVAAAEKVHLRAHRMSHSIAARPIPRSRGRVNAAGLDLSNEQRLVPWASALLSSAGHVWRAMPMLADTRQWDEARALPLPIPRPPRYRRPCHRGHDNELAYALDSRRHAARSGPPRR